MASWVLMMGCTSGGKPDVPPQLDGVEPAWAFTTQTTSIELRGAAFMLRPTLRLGSVVDDVSVDARFVVFLGEQRLDEVTWVDPSALRAVVPAGLPPGRYDVRLVDPYGVEAALTGAFEVRAPPSTLSATSTWDRRVYSVGQPIKVEVQAHNAGPTLVRGVAPVLVVSPMTLVAPLTETPPRDLAGGATENFPLVLEALAPGSLTIDVSARGVEALTASPVVTSPQRQTLTIVTTAQLSLQLEASAPQLEVGQALTLRATVLNTGQAAALAVSPVVRLDGDGLTALLSPNDSDVGAAPVLFEWQYQAVSAGTVVLTVAAGGFDENSAQPTNVAVASVSVEIRNPTGSPDGGADAGAVDAGSTEDAGAVDAGSIDDAGAADAGSAEDAGAADAGAVDAGAADAGAVDAGAADAGAVDAGAVDAGAVDAGAVDAGAVDAGAEARTLFADPFGDGTTATFVVGYRSKVYVGPNKTGAGAIRFDPDGTSPESISFAFQRDSIGNSSANTSSSPYPSIGATGCTANSAGCGPDNENGRALFFAAEVADAGWLGVAGAKTGQNFSYVYLTPDSDAVLDFRYVDVSSSVGGGTCILSSATTLAGRLYLGLGGSSGGRRPGLLALSAAPPSPGLDPTSAQLVDLDADKMPGIANGGGAGNDIMVDAMGVLNDRLYLGAYGGWVRSTVATPRSFALNASDWAACTPTDAAYAAKTSTTTTKRADLEPADRAIPAFATYAGRLYVARNTTLGPQLWGCDPATSGSATDCDPGDWTLVAPNTVGDTQLTQFNDVGNTRITLLQATASHLFVGFNNTVRGVVTFRSVSLSPQTRADFTGRGDCAATQYPLSCDGYGTSGLGVGASRVYSSVVLPFAGSDFLYVAAGNGTTAAKIIRVDP
ncbi:MAG: hypothetical protein Q8N23_17990 [Archangium sp.]|nr:hypothetical protein [Archangium sp.]MDP3574325.1 hypothetical protein [Archangium sp.]